MGYIKNLRENIDERLSMVDEHVRRDIADFIAKVVLESYRNGQKEGQGTKKAPKDKSAKMK